MKKKVIAVSLALIGLAQAPAMAAPALTTATLHKLDAIVGPLVNQDANAFSSSFAALEPLRPGTPGACVDALAAPGNGRKLWAVYMIGSDLESGGGFATTNFNQLVAGWQAQGKPADTDIIVAFGGANKDGWKGVRWATMPQILADAADGIYGNEPDSFYTFVDHSANMGSAATFRTFVDHVHQHYGEASRRFLSFWNHGSSYNATPGIGPDEVSREVLDLSRINHQLVDSGSCWHIIGFDACLMASMESARALRDSGGYMLASEELEPGHGWNYQNVLDAWLNQPEVVAAGRAMVDAFVRSDAHAYPSSGKTLSLVNLSAYDQAAAAVSDAGTLLAGMLATGQGQPVIQAFANSQRYAGKFTIDPSAIPAQASIDAADFLQLVSARVTDYDTARSLQTAINALEAMVIHSADDGSRPYSKGIAIAPPDMNANHAAEQQQAGLITAGWTELVATWDQLQRSALDHPEPLPVTSDVPGASLAFLDRWGRGTSNPDLADSLGATGGFQSPWLMETMTSYGDLREDGAYLMLGEYAAHATTGGGIYAPRWNGMSVHFIDDGQLLPVPMFLDQASGSWAGIVGFPDATEEEPELGVLMVFENPEEGSDELGYGVAPILELGDGRWIMGRMEADFFEAGDRVSFLSLLIAPDGEAYMAEYARHTFTGPVTPVMSPFRASTPVWAFTGYTIADAASVAPMLDVSEADRVFNWAGTTYPALLPDLDAENLYLGGYYGRCNDARSLCLAAQGGDVWYWDGASLGNLGPVSGWFEQARAAGF